jgi:glucosamine kinase
LQGHYFIGVDGGGTKCKALLQNQSGEIIGEGLSGSANPATDFSLALHSIVDACELALAQAQLSPNILAHCHVGMGLAGVNLPSIKHKMLQWQHPFATVHLTTDLHIACLGAHGGQDGAVIISGTGSSAFAVLEGQQLNLGGHGFTAGDKGGGAWIGLSATRLCLEAMDGIGVYSPLVETLKQQLACKDATAVAEIVNGAPAVFFAGLAPLVIAAAEQNDPIAMSILREGADYLSHLARRLLTFSEQNLSMIGGLAKQLEPWLASDVQAKLSKALHEPDYGALLLAQQQTGVTKADLLIQKTQEGTVNER